MSQPFAGACLNDMLRVVQLCHKDGAKWSSKTLPLSVLSLDVSPNYKFHIDLHKPDAKLVYIHPSCSKEIEVRHSYQKHHPVVSCISNTDVNTKVKPPSLQGTDVLFHLGDNVWAERCFLTRNLDLLAELYIQTWALLPMPEMEHRLIPDDTDLGLHPGFRRYKHHDFSPLVRFTDVLTLAINGVERQPHHYYTTYFDTHHTRYLAISNWVPDGNNQPHFVDNTEIVNDLLTQHPLTPKKHVVLMMSRCTFAVTQTLTLHRLILDDAYKHNANSYKAFAQLKHHWRCNLTIVCGDIALPIAFQVTVNDNNRLITYPMYATGAYSCHIEDHSSADFELSPTLNVQLRKLPHQHHLEQGHSYLRFLMHKPHRVYVDHDPMHSLKVLTKYLINGVL